MTSTLHIILYQPEIPPNTGNIIRLCAATGCQLHLVGPLGFRLDAPSVRRAGMDYQEFAEVHRYNNWEAYQQKHPDPTRLFPITTKACQYHHQTNYQPGDRFLFGSEGSGLPKTILDNHKKNLLRIPIIPQARSLNLANSVAIVLFEALRQIRFPGLM